MNYCIDAWITSPSLSGDEGDQNWTTKYLAYACFPEDNENEDQSDDNKLAYSLFPIGKLDVIESVPTIRLTLTSVFVYFVYFVLFAETERFSLILTE